MKGLSAMDGLPAERRSYDLPRCFHTDLKYFKSDPNSNSYLDYVEKTQKETILDLFDKY